VLKIQLEDSSLFGLHKVFKSKEKFFGPQKFCFGFSWEKIKKKLQKREVPVFFQPITLQNVGFYT
jgi:hypothetical protein